MAKAKVNYFGMPDTGPLGPYGRTIFPTAPARCSQDRKLVATIGAFDNSTPTDTIQAETHFAQVLAEAAVLIFCGPAATSSAVKQARAVALPASHLYAFDCKPGDVLYIWSDAA